MVVEILEDVAGMRVKYRLLTCTQTSKKLP